MEHRIGEPSHRRTVASANRRIGEPSPLCRFLKTDITSLTNDITSPHRLLYSRIRIYNKTLRFSP
ncbi:hypothetical protein [Spirosoma endbachense]|uniref:Uncharacterized protein n=1 Tax=Spirosoma endbachense TaxID=2666025 RepID=A0A6P1VYE9_9BACT|nr:hypothetical protein [Spirosoma endbachense]QHV98231.1 hypothetical protein GJR95_25940 [Spirosoma endbachense]